MTKTPSIGATIVKHNIRYDLEIIARLIKPNTKVLDIGCGDGELLAFLKHTKNVDARGLEISQQEVSKALGRGISVIQGNAEDDLTYYPTKSFDYAILSQTIQSTQKPKEILREMLRVANYAIVSLPNFAHIKNRLHLLTKGTMPVNKNIPYQWYDTPNIHFCSIEDFENLCHELNFKVERKIFLTNKHRLISFFGNKLIANLFAQYGIFLITENNFAATNQEEFSKNNLNLARNLSTSFACRASSNTTL